MPCPFFEHTEHAFVICYCPGMDYRIIQQYSTRRDKEIQLNYCGSNRTARYCPMYRAIEAKLAKPRPAVMPERMSRYELPPGMTLEVRRGAQKAKPLPRSGRVQRGPQGRHSPEPQVGRER